jgi:hypothetical protein
MMNKNLKTLAALLALTALLTAPAADAGMLDKLLGGDEGKDARPPRYDLFPKMGFFTGTLGRDIGTGWTLDGYRLILASECTISSEVHDVPMLDEGRQALVMGPKVGDTIVAWRVRIKQDEYGIQANNPEEQFTPSDSDPTVGEGSGPE